MLEFIGSIVCGGMWFSVVLFFNFIFLWKVYDIMCDLWVF